MILLVFLIVVTIAIMLSTVFIVKQQSIAIIERFGKYKHTKSPGLHIRAPFGIDIVAARVPLRVQQDNISVETKTKDNVFVNLDLAVQYRVDEQKVVESYYKLQAPVLQIRSYIEDAIRSALPVYTLDEAFEKKDEIAQDVFKTVSEEMSGYGYIIVKTLITAIEPDSKVKNSMNEINAAQRTRVAAQELANADKIRVVTAAEADAEKDRLHGVGLAEQRKAIVDGLAKSFAEFRNTGLTESDIMSILLTEQWIDTMNTFAKSGKSNSIFLPSGSDAANDIRAQVLSAFEAQKNNQNN